jgi:hypothetical protein
MPRSASFKYDHKIATSCIYPLVAVATDLIISSHHLFLLLLYPTDIALLHTTGTSYSYLALFSMKSPTMRAAIYRKSRLFAILTLVGLLSVANIHFSAEPEEFRELFNQATNITPFIDANSKAKHATNELKDVPVVESRKVPRVIDPSNLDLSPQATFSACLLIKDDNDILSEWIAYHYHVLKMRKIIVAVDPLSTESPSHILQRWSMTDLEIFEWSDEQFMPDHFIKTGEVPPAKPRLVSTIEKKHNSQADITEIIRHRYRQRVFYAKCIRDLRDKGSSWTIHIDTDEYAVPNKQLRQQTPTGFEIPPIEQPGSVLNILQQTVAEQFNVSYPCIPAHRVIFGSDESSYETLSLMDPPGFNASRFETLRWRYHAPMNKAILRGRPKAILDVSAIPEEFMPVNMVHSIHKPIEKLCIQNVRYPPVSLNHYLGSWERYNARDDKRRSRAKYEEKASKVSAQPEEDDVTGLWLKGFVDYVGKGVAAELLGQTYLEKGNPV